MIALVRHLSTILSSNRDALSVYLSKLFGAAMGIKKWRPLSLFVGLNVRPEGGSCTFGFTMQPVYTWLPLARLCFVFFNTFNRHGATKPRSLVCGELAKAGRRQNRQKLRITWIMKYAVYREG